MCSARLRTSLTSQADSTIPQADSEVSQASGASPLNSTTLQAVLVPRKQWLSPMLAIILPRQVAVQAGHSPGATGVLPGSGLPKLPKGETLFPRQIVLPPREAIIPPPYNIRTNSPQGSPMEGPNPKRVVNLSSKPLTQAQRSVLAKGPNFAVSLGIPLT